MAPKDIIPAALTEEQIKDVESRLGTFPYYSIARVRLVALCAMARERNALIGMKAQTQNAQQVAALYGQGILP